MVKSVAAPQAKGKSAEDKIFGANNRAVALTEKLGADKVINGTVGSMLDEDGNLIMLDVVQKAYKALTPKEIVAYAPIQGYPDYWKLLSTSASVNPVRKATSAPVLRPAVPVSSITSFTTIPNGAMKS